MEQLVTGESFADRQTTVVKILVSGGKQEEEKRFRFPVDFVPRCLRISENLQQKLSGLTFN